MNERLGPWTQALTYADVGRVSFVATCLYYLSPHHLPLLNQLFSLKASSIFARMMVLFLTLPTCLRLGVQIEHCVVGRACSQHFCHPLQSRCMLRYIYIYIYVCVCVCVASIVPHTCSFVIMRNMCKPCWPAPFIPLLSYPFFPSISALFPRQTHCPLFPLNTRIHDIYRSQSAGLCKVSFLFSPFHSLTEWSH